MSKIKSVLSAIQRIPSGASADGGVIGVGLTAALRAQRARGAEPMEQSDQARSARVSDAGDGRHAPVH